MYDPTDPVGRLLFNVLAMVAEFEADLIRSRTRSRAPGQRAPNGTLSNASPTEQPSSENSSRHAAAGSATGQPFRSSFALQDGDGAAQLALSQTG